MKEIIQCQEEIYLDRRSSKSTKPKTARQCTLTAKYKMNTIDLYICGVHAIGVDKKRLIKLK